MHSNMIDNLLIYYLRVGGNERNAYEIWLIKEANRLNPEGNETNYS